MINTLVLLIECLYENFDEAVIRLRRYWVRTKNYLEPQQLHERATLYVFSQIPGASSSTQENLNTISSMTNKILGVQVLEAQQS